MTFPKAGEWRIGDQRCSSRVLLVQGDVYGCHSPSSQCPVREEGSNSISLLISALRDRLCHEEPALSESTFPVKPSGWIS